MRRRRGGRRSGKGEDWNHKRRRKRGPGKSCREHSNRKHYLLLYTQIHEAKVCLIENREHSSWYVHGVVVSC